MAGFPDMFIPLIMGGRVAFWHDFAHITLVAGSTLSITHGPPSPGYVYIYFLGNTGRPRRTDTDEVVRTTNAYLEHYLEPQTAMIKTYPIKFHRDNLMESVYMPDYPLVTYTLSDKPLQLKFTNNETFNITWDLTFWILETSLIVFEKEVQPYLQGYMNFYTAFSEPEAVSGMTELFKLFADPAFVAAVKQLVQARSPAALSPLRR